MTFDFQSIIDERIDNMSVRVLQLPVIGDLLHDASAVVLRLMIPLLCYASRFRRLKEGACIFWAPESLIPVITSGLEFLRLRDQAMFSRLTDESIVIYYCGDSITHNTGGTFFGLHKNYLDWGPDGVATFLVHSLLTHCSCGTKNPNRLASSERAVLQGIPQRVTEWMASHGVREDLVLRYQQMTQRWHQRQSTTKPNPQTQ